MILRKKERGRQGREKQTERDAYDTENERERKREKPRERDACDTEKERERK